MCLITVKLADGRTKTYQSADEWAKDVEAERAKGIDRAPAPQVTTRQPAPTIGHIIGVQRRAARVNSYLKPRRKAFKAPPSRMSTAGLEGVSAESSLTKQYQKLSKKTRR